MVNSTITAPELTHEQVQAILVKPLADKSVFLSAGPRIFDSANPVRIPKLGGPVADPGWTGENVEIPERDATFGEIELLPSTMKSVKVLTRYSNELARQSIVSLDAALRDRLVTDVANKLDTQFLGATGDGITEPTGLFAYADTQEVEVTGALTLDTLIDAWGKALSANVSMESLKWIMRPDEFIALRKIKDGNQRYMLQPDPTLDGVFRLFGSPVIVTGRIPEKSAALVDFSQIAVARDLAPSVKILDQTFADFDQQAIRVVARYDAAPMNPESVVKITGIGSA